MLVLDIANQLLAAAARAHPGVLNLIMCYSQCHELQPINNAVMNHVPNPASPQLTSLSLPKLTGLPRNKVSREFV